MTRKVTGKYIFSCAACLAILCASVSTDPAFGQDQGAPPWGEFLKRFNKDRLLKPPYHMEEAEGEKGGPKGLASKIRARELDVPNRIRAIRYLASLDCAQFPEAKQMLLEMLSPEKEQWEEVRFAAAIGLRDMLGRNACPSGNCQATQQNAGILARCKDSASKALQRENAKTAASTSCRCTNCCDAETMKTIAKTAYEMKEDGCCYEPSRRVREMAVEAIRVCGIPCNFSPYYASEEMAPFPVDEEVIQPKDDDIKIRDREGTPPVREREGTPGDEASLREVPLLQIEATSISRLTDLCIVSLKEGRKASTDKNVKTEYRGRIYYFSDEQSRRKFIANPEAYAVSFGGCDPVEFVSRRKIKEGRFLVNHEGRYYLFSTMENYEKFKANPIAYQHSAKPNAWVVSK